MSFLLKKDTHTHSWMFVCSLPGSDGSFWHLPWSSSYVWETRWAAGEKFMGWNPWAPKNMCFFSRCPFCRRYIWICFFCWGRCGLRLPWRLEISSILEGWDLKIAKVKACCSFASYERNDLKETYTIIILAITFLKPDWSNTRININMEGTCPSNNLIPSNVSQFWRRSNLFQRLESMSLVHLHMLHPPDNASPWGVEAFGRTLTMEATWKTTFLLHLCLGFVDGLQVEGSTSSLLKRNTSILLLRKRVPAGHVFFAVFCLVHQWFLANYLINRTTFGLCLLCVWMWSEPLKFKM